MSTPARSMILAASRGSVAGFACVVVNPGALGFRAEGWPALRRRLASQLGRCEFVCTDDVSRARFLVDQMCARGCTLLVVVGGDGSVQLGLAAIGDRPIPLTIVPMGTANDLARSVQGDVAGGKSIDLITVNGRRFATTGGIGLPSEVVRAVQGLREHPGLRPWLRFAGPWIYPLVTLDRLARKRHVVENIRIEARDAGGTLQVVDTPASAVLVSNQPRLGATLLVSAESRHDDGFFEITVITARTRLGLLQVLGRMLMGLPPAPRHVVRMRATEATIACATPQSFLADGDALFTDRTFRLAILPGALRLGR